MGVCEQSILHVLQVVMHSNHAAGIHELLRSIIALNRLLCDLGRLAYGRRASCLKINIKGGNYAALHLWPHAGFESHMRASQMY